VLRISCFLLLPLFKTTRHRRPLSILPCLEPLLYLGAMIRALQWTAKGVVMLDQRRLPAEEIYNTYRSVPEIAEAIQTMVVRGAPAIGVAAAMGIALGAQQLGNSPNLEADFDSICQTLQQTRPTARNLFWAIERMQRVFQDHKSRPLTELARELENEALEMQREDIATNRAIGAHGERLLAQDCTVLTHCNTGSLATSGYGTALGIVRAAVEAGKQIAVFADETRPFLQGARLTAWEMMKENIPCTLITDSMAGHFMRQGAIQAVVVGADRIAANGDTANKIGTYSVAVLARAHDLPFYVAAPLSTIDLDCLTGKEIPIEQRDPREVTVWGDQTLAPANTRAANPAFDVTPNELITAIITEVGIAQSPYRKSLANCFSLQKSRSC